MTLPVANPFLAACAAAPASPVASGNCLPQLTHHHLLQQPCACTDTRSHHTSGTTRAARAACLTPIGSRRLNFGRSGRRSFLSRRSNPTTDRGHAAALPTSHHAHRRHAIADFNPDRKRRVRTDDASRSRICEPSAELWPGESAVCTLPGTSKRGGFATAPTFARSFASGLALGAPNTGASAPRVDSVTAT